MLSQAKAQLFIPDGLPEAEALSRTTHMGIGAHPDDLEFMAWSAILGCFRDPRRWFCGVIVTDGAQGPRGGPYAGYSDEELGALRLEEQRKAARLGEYGALAALGFSSAAVRAPRCEALRADIRALVLAARPEVIFTHNLADAHQTHLAVALHVIAALRELPAEARPRALYGCEVWRGLDWLPAQHRRSFDVGGREHLMRALMGVYDSQISGGKRYDLASLGRRWANATYSEARLPDRAEAVEHAMDLSPLLHDPGLDPRAFLASLLQRFADELAGALSPFFP